MQHWKQISSKNSEITKIILKWITGTNNTMETCEEA
jgi:hypothetical protein